MPTKGEMEKRREIYLIQEANINLLHSNRKLEGCWGRKENMLQGKWLVPT